MSDATTVSLPSARERFQRESIWIKIGFITSVCFLVLLDGVDGAMTSSIGRYLSGSFSANPDQITWGTIIYYVSKLYALLLAARLQERIGQRRAVLGVSVVLVLSTIGSAFIVNYPSLLVALVIQGAAGGMMDAFGLGVLLMLFSRRDQTLVLPFYSVAAIMFPGLAAQIYVGAFAYLLYWQDAYLWIAPFGLLGCGWLFWHRKLLSNATHHLPIPVLKIVLLVTSLVAVVYVLQQGNRNRWLEFPPIVWSLLLAAVCLLALAFTETDGRPTYLHYHAFRYANFTYGCSIAILAGIAFLGGGSVISEFNAGVLSYPVLYTGLVQLSASVFATIALLGAGLVLRFTKIPGVLILVTGQLMLSIGMWNLGLAPSNSNFGAIAFWLSFRGFALGCQFLPLTFATLTCLPPEDDVAAAGLFNFNRQLGALIGIAWFQTLHETLTDRNQTVFGNDFSAVSPNAITYTQAAQHALTFYGIDPQTSQAATALTLQEASRQWASIAYNGSFESLAVLFLFTLPLVILVRILTTRFLKPACL